MAPTIWEPSNVYASAKLGEDVSVGKFTEIGPEVSIGDRTRIGAHCFIPEGVSIGNDCFIGPMVYMTNDRFPPSEKSKWKKTIIEDEAAIGAGVTILCGVTIGRKSMIGCGSVVVQSVPPNEIWVGVPAKKLRDRPA
jgi:acetyltransferase-like isoleucine patch superfamily enzyme